MSPGSRRVGAVSGLLLTLCWSPMAFALPHLPDLDSASEVEAFWLSRSVMMQLIILSASVGFGFLLAFLGTLAEHLASASSPALTYTAYGSALMFTTAFDVALGLDVAGGLMVSTAPAGTYVLHSAGFLLAAPAAAAGATFFVAVAVHTFRDHGLPRWSGWIALVGVVANLGALSGLFSLSGPLNSGNGAIGGIAAPVGLHLLWISAISVWWMSTRSAPRTDRIGTAS